MTSLERRRDDLRFAALLLFGMAGALLLPLLTPINFDTALLVMWADSAFLGALAALYWRRLLPRLDRLRAGERRRVERTHLLLMLAAGSVLYVGLAVGILLADAYL